MQIFKKKLYIINFILRLIIIMQLTYNNNKLKIDNGDHYYTGIINQNDFPSIISNDYEDIILKSFDNFSDDNTNITHNILEDLFTIDFKFNCKPLKISEIIKIKLTKHEKDYKDYTNERIEKLENENKEMKIKMAELASILLKKDDTEEDEEEEDAEDEEKDESDESVVEPDESKFNASKIKGGKAFIVQPKAVVQTKGGKKAAGKVYA